MYIRNRFELMFFDGEQIKLHTPSLGYILGDEGSGAVPFGRKFINAIIKGSLPQSMREDFLERNRLTVSDIINTVYKGTAPNRFLASTSEFISQHIDQRAVRRFGYRQLQGIH